jgi:hypothetical protein
MAMHGEEAAVVIQRGGRRIGRGQSGWRMGGFGYQESLAG